MGSGLLHISCASIIVLIAAATVAPSAPAADFRSSATSACVRYDRTTNALPPITTAAELKRQLVLVPRLFRAMVDRVAATPAPYAQQAQVSRFVGSLRQVQRILVRIRDAFLRGDQAGVQAAVRDGRSPSRNAARAATALGLPTCARLALAAAKAGTR